MTTYDQTYVDTEGYEHRYARHTHTTDETIRCIYCHADVLGCEECPTAPPDDDDSAWAEIAAQHAEGCEWVRTRSHRLA